MDLKPQNILLTSINNPSLKLGGWCTFHCITAIKILNRHSNSSFFLIDFGFAQNLKNRNGSSLRGSPLYMAPEIIKHRNYDSKVDLWSVGVILYGSVGILMFFS